MSTGEMILAGMQLFISAATIITLLYTLRKFLKKPQETLEKRVSDLEKDVKDVKDSLLKGNDRFREQEEANDVLIHCVLALIEFEIQYCLTENKSPSDDLKKAKEILHNYLAKK
jgi:hypothetical protein